MNEGLIASRYAGALLQYAIEHHADTDLYHMMKQVADCYLNVPDLGRTFGNWTLDTEKRKALFLDLFPAIIPNRWTYCPIFRFAYQSKTGKRHAFRQFAVCR